MISVADDAYLFLVKALISNAMGATPSVKQTICSIMAGLLRAVPAWMLHFGVAHNPGCSARGGFEAFLVTVYICVLGFDVRAAVCLPLLLCNVKCVYLVL